MSYYPQQPPYGGHSAYADAPTPGIPIGLPTGPPPPVPYNSHPDYGAPQGYPGQYYPPTNPPVGHAQPYYPPAGPPQTHGYHYPPPPVPQSSYPGHSSYPSAPHPPHYAPPPQNYSSYPGAPPFGVPQPYGAPPQQDPLWYLGTPVPSIFTAPGQHVVPGYDPTADADRIRRATKGMGTDDQTLILTLVPLSAVKIEALAHKFTATYGKPLVKVLDSETSGYFKKAIHALATGPLAWDAELIQGALAGLGTKEEILTELLLGRPSAEVRLLVQAYRFKFGRDLAKEVREDLSAKTERMFTMALNSDRPPDSTPVNHESVARDVDALYKAGQARLGTDQMVFCDVLINRSQPHITAVIDAYKRKYKSLSKVIKSEFSGHMKDGFLYIVNGAKSKHDRQGLWRDAKLLDKAMAGLGTKDNQLVWRMVRAHWDPVRMEGIKAAYFRRKQKTLEHSLVKETSGSYQKLMVALVKASNAPSVPMR